MPTPFIRVRGFFLSPLDLARPVSMRRRLNKILARWIMGPGVACVAVAGAAHAQYTPVDGPMTVWLDGRTYLLSEHGQTLRDGTATPEGLALCAAMKLPSDGRCEWDTILDAARDQIDPELWLDGPWTKSDQTNPERCRRAVLLETYPDGATIVHVYGCHVETRLTQLRPR